MSTAERLSNLTMNDEGPLGSENSVMTPTGSRELALREANNDLDYTEGNNLAAKDNDCPEYDPALCRIYRYTPTPTLVLDQDQRIVEVSDSHCALSGLRRNSLVGACAYNVPVHLVPAPDSSTLHGALHASITSRQVQVIEGTSAEIGKSFYYRLRITPIFRGSSLLYLVLEVHDISKEDEVSTQGQEAYINETYRVLVDTVKDYAIFMLDTQGTITTWNSGAAILKGYSPSEIIGKHFSVFYGDEDRRAEKPRRGLDMSLQQGRMEDEGWRYRQDGSRFWADVIITPIYQFGQHVGFVKVTRDLTERKAAESRMIAAFEESSKMKTDFLANMSHEIRTPMNGMQVALTMLMDTELSDKQREYASIIEDSMSVLLQIINDVLDYTKLSSGSFSLKSDVVNVESIISAVVRNCKSSLMPSVEISCSLAPDLPKVVRGDPLRYRQVVQNIVGNAVKFTESGSIRVSATSAADSEDPEAYIITTEVSDTGIGVSGDALNTLFHPFTRFAGSSSRIYQGTGLGLSICKSLAELMDGRIGYRPGPEGKGSVFWFTAKMGRTDIMSPRRDVEHRVPDDTKELMGKIRELAPNKHILLVEDNLVNSTVMLKLLQNAGFDRIDIAWNGAEAVRLLRKTPLSYNLVLMDISMPVMDGMEATSQIRSMGIGVPIIALTANVLKDDVDTYLAKGMNDYIGKPVNRKRLLHVLWNWLGR